MSAPASVITTTADCYRLLEEKEETVSELESTMERIQDNKDNSKRLLETVEGDKTALSRALSQNKQLKTQLEELETRYVVNEVVTKQQVRLSFARNLQWVMGQRGLVMIILC